MYSSETGLELARLRPNAQRRALRMFSRSHSFSSSRIPRLGMRSSSSSGASGVFPSPTFNSRHDCYSRFSLRLASSRIFSFTPPTAWFSSAMVCSTASTSATDFFACPTFRQVVQSSVLGHEGVNQVASQRVRHLSKAVKGYSILGLRLFELCCKRETTFHAPGQFEQSYPRGFSNRTNPALWWPGNALGRPEMAVDFVPVAGDANS